MAKGRCALTSADARALLDVMVASTYKIRHEGVMLEVQAGGMESTGTDNRGTLRFARSKNYGWWQHRVVRIASAGNTVGWRCSRCMRNTTLLAIPHDYRALKGKKEKKRLQRSYSSEGHLL